MKYALLIGDGMGDYPRPEYNGKTVLTQAQTPNLDFMAQNGLLGRAQTVPEGMAPGSDVAIMSLMGYYPKGVLSGRGPLEAASIGIKTAPDELVFRLNLVTLDLNGGTTMLNHAAGNITTAEALELLDALRAQLPLTEGQRIFPGVSFRHILTWPGLSGDGLPSVPPHDHRNKNVDHIINDPKGAILNKLVKASWAILKDHPVNLKRREQGLPEANSLWLWGQGLCPQVKTYGERWGISGAAVSAVDLIKGLGVVTGLEAIDVPGATGWIDTNYEGKVAAALKALETKDYVVVHLEAPDEASHQGELEYKLKAIEDFDAKVVGPMLKGMARFGDFKVLAACDHYTPVELMTHSSDAVPFVIYSNKPDEKLKASGRNYDEANAAATNVLVDPAADLSKILFGEEK